MAFGSPKSKNSFPALLHLTYKLQQKCDEIILREVGVSLSQIRIMSALHESLPRSQRVIAGQLSQTEANISRQIRLMQKKGLVSIRKNKKDKRTRDVNLTGKGAKKYSQSLKLIDGQYTGWLKLLGKNDLKAFASATESLFKKLN